MKRITRSRAHAVPRGRLGAGTTGGTGRRATDGARRRLRQLLQPDRARPRRRDRVLSRRLGPRSARRARRRERESRAAQHVRLAGCARSAGQSRDAGRWPAASRWSRSRTRAGSRSSGASRTPARSAFVVTVRDLDGTLARLEALGAPVVSRSGEPVTIGAGTRIVIVKDPDGHFVELSQPAELPSTTAPAERERHRRAPAPRRRPTSKPPRASTATSSGSKRARAARRIRQQRGRAGRARFGERPVSRRASRTCRRSGLMYDFVDFKGVERKNVQGRIQDFGSTRVQLRVRDVDAAIAVFERFGGEVVSTGGEAARLAGRQLHVESRDRARPEQFVRRADRGSTSSLTGSRTKGGQRGEARCTADRAPATAFQSMTLPVPTRSWYVISSAGTQWICSSQRCALPEFSRKRLTSLRHGSV